MDNVIRPAWVTLYIITLKQLNGKIPTKQYYLLAKMNSRTG